MVQRIRVFFTGLLCGGAVGAGLAFALTPHSGEQLRQHMRQRWQLALVHGARSIQAQRQALWDDLHQKTALPNEPK
jgi:gas vesicle protein